MKNLIILGVVLLTVCSLERTIFSQEISQTKSLSETLNLAEAKTAAKEWKDAAALWEKITAANPVNGDFWARLGDARYNVKDYKGAIPAYEKAFELGGDSPYNSAYNITASYALLGDKKQALKWLEKSLAVGFPNLDGVRKDKDLKSLREDVRFKKLVFGEDVTKMSCNEGWRYDVTLLAAEIKRTAINPFYRTSEKDFDAAVKSLLERIPQLSDAQIDVELRKLIALLGRSHSIFFGSGRTDKTFLQPLPFQVYFFEEGLFIVAADAKHADLVGAQILTWGGHTPDEILKTLTPLISSSNVYRPLRIAPELLRGAGLTYVLGLNPDKDKVVLSLKDFDGKTRTVTVNADPTFQGYADVPPTTWTFLEQVVQKPLPLYLKNRYANIWYEYEPNTKTMFLALPDLRRNAKTPHQEVYQKLFKEIDERQVDRFVIDFRNNGGGNTFNAIPLVNEILKRDKINQPGKLFVIIGRQTLSAAINVVDLLESRTNAILVGEPSSDFPNFVGESNVITMPYSKSRALISNLYWQYSSPQDKRIWVAPTIYAPPAFKLSRENRDPAMEAILAYGKTN